MYGGGGVCDVSLASEVQRTTFSGRSLRWGDDGSVLYTIIPDGSSVTDYVRGYDVGTVYDIDTIQATYTQTVSGSESVDGLDLSPDGTRLYDCGQGSRPEYIGQHTLSTAWDLSTATLEKKVTPPSYSGGTVEPIDIRWSPDGELAFLLDPVADKLFGASASTPWDAETLGVVYESETPNAPTNMQDMAWTDDGLNVFMSGTDGYLYHWYLDTRWIPTPGNITRSTSYDTSGAWGGLASSPSCGTLWHRHEMAGSPQYLIEYDITA